MSSENEPAFVLTRTIAAPQDAVWKNLLKMIEGANPDGYETPGDPAPHGLGSVIVLNLDGRSMREFVTEYAAPRLRRYAIPDDAPVEGYEGLIELDETAQTEPSTNVTWTIWATAHDDAGHDFIAFAKTFLTGAIDMLEHLSIPAG